MKELLCLFKYEAFNVLRGRWLVAYALLFAGLTAALLQFGGDSAKAVASLTSVVLLIIPMVSMLFSAIYWYGSEHFTGLLLTQPVKRRNVFIARWLAISAALAGSFALGCLPMLAMEDALGPESLLLLAIGVALTLAFVGIGLAFSVCVNDRMMGIGAVFIGWFYFAVIHDALVFAIVSAFGDYPLEGPSILLTASNPIDLARLSLLMAVDFSALMGYTGRLLQRALSGASGQLFVATALSLWAVLPVAFGVGKFGRKDI